MQHTAFEEAGHSDESRCVFGFHKVCVHTNGTQHSLPVGQRTVDLGQHRPKLTRLSSGQASDLDVTEGPIASAFPNRRWKH